MAFFFFGTLRDPDVLALVLDRPLRTTDRVDAFLPGHRAVCARGQPFPLLVEAPGVSAPGSALLRPSRRDEARITWFEEDEYRAEWRTVRVGDAALRARVFFAVDGFRAGMMAWDYVRWRRAEKARYLRQCATWLRELEEV